MRHVLRIAILLALAACPACAEVKKAPDASDEFFDRGVIPQLKIELEPQAADSLRQDARRYVKCRLVENGEMRYADVAIKLKGAAGSFRGLDDRPALTLNMDRHVKGQTFHAMDKFHLNNSVQDETYLCEWICADLCQEAGLPASRVTHARVWLNDRDLGLYVLKEGFDRPFLKRQFGDAGGNLYDGGFVADIDSDLEKDSGKGPDDHSDLRALRAACQEPDEARRHEEIAARLDVEKFLTFMAIELMACHWDGYTKNRNNYRVYFDPRSSKACFLPHGMDQMFQDPNFSILEFPEPIVSRAVMHDPAWRKAYRARVAELLPLLAPPRIAERIDLVSNRLKPVLAAMRADAATAHVDRAREMKTRIAERERLIREQLRESDPSPQEFNEQGIAEIADWFPAQEAEDAKLEEREVDGRKRYTIAVGDSGNCVASWRRKVLLGRGRYRLEARLKAEGIEPRRDEQGIGAGVRISGGRRENQLVGDSEWRTVSQEIEVAETMREVLLVIELRATRGRLLIESPPRLVRLEPR